MSVEIVSGEFQHPDQSAATAVDDLVPTQIPFVPSFVVFNTTNRDVPILPLYGAPDNTDSGDIFQGISMSTGWALYSDTPGAARQFVHARSVPYKNDNGNENHKSSSPGAIRFFGPMFAILPGIANASVQEYVLSGGNYDLLIRWAIPRNGVGGANPLAAGGLVRWMAVGGSDITAAAIVNWQLTSRADLTWTQDIVDQFAFGPAIGFKPDFLWTQYWVGNNEADTFNNGRKHGMSWANCALEQTTIGLRDETFLVPTDTKQWQQPDAMMVLRRTSGKFTVTLDEMLDTGGFRVRVDNPSASLPPPEGGALTLAVQGLSSKISRLVAPTTTVDADGVNPQALLTMSDGEPPQGAADEIGGSRLSYGYLTNDSQWCMGNDFPNGQSFTPVGPFFIPSSGNAWSADYDGSILAKLTAATGAFVDPGPATTLDARAVASDFTTLAWPLDDSSGLEVLTCVLGDGGGGTCAGAVGGAFAGTWVDTQMVPVWR